jgi:hypothetical protein
MIIKYNFSEKETKEAIKFWANQVAELSDPEVEIKLTTVLTGYGVAEKSIPHFEIIITSEGNLLEDPEKP